MTERPGLPDLVLLDGVRWFGTPIAGERLHALLAALVQQRGRVASDQRLAEEVWTDDPPSHPTKALQVLVSRARSQTSPDVIERLGNGYRLGIDRARVDALMLQTLLDEARVAWRGGNVAATLDSARSANVFTVVGPGQDPVGPLATVRAAARAEIAQARALLGLALGASGEHAEALPVLEEALATRPEDEALVGAVLRSEAVVRGVPAALDRYERYRRRLRDRLGTDPGDEMQRLHRELLAQDRPVRAGVLFDHTRLVGRAGDIKALSAMLRTSRVTSIVGAGGLGKTRLAHVMGRRAEQPVVHLVELAGVTSPDHVVLEVGSALGVRGSLSGLHTQTPMHQADLRARVVEKLAVAPALLILDNCEHVLDAVADLVAVLVASTRELTVLTTSRAPLGLAAERVYQLPQLGEVDGVDLFRERATAARPGVLLNDERVQDLVARLDGLPLAIELAAAKVRVMSVDDITRRLTNRFELLRGGDRTAPERHQTLLAVIDWSWNLLDEKGRLALRRLSVFRDGFSLPGAAAVIDGVADPLAAVEDLVQQSLLSVHEVDGAVRYRLLETVREFGRMRLVDSGEEEIAERELRDWALDFCTGLDLDLFSPRQPQVVDQVRIEEGNLVDVLRRALDERDALTVVALMATLGAFWSIEGSHVKVIALGPAVGEVVADFDPPEEMVDRVRLVLSLVVTHAVMVLGVPASRVEARLRELGTGSADPRVAATAVLALTMAAAHDDAQAEALEELCESDEPVLARAALQWYSHARENDGDVEAAVTAARRALALCDDQDGPWTRANLNAHLAELAMQGGDVVNGREHAMRAVETLERLGASDDVSQVKAMLAMCDLAEGDLAGAERRFREIEQRDLGRSTFGGALVAGTGRAELALAAGEVQVGLQRYRQAVEALRQMRVPGLAGLSGLEPWMLYCEAAALAAHVVQGHPHDAGDLAAELTTKLGLLLEQTDWLLDYPVAGSVLFALALWRLATDGPDGADTEVATRLLVVADRFAYNRTMPSLDWSAAVDLAEHAAPGLLERHRDELGAVPAPELRDEARHLVAEL